jgi:hypothetical protein
VGKNSPIILFFKEEGLVKVICLWKYSHVNGGTSFNGGRILPESDLNYCMDCEGVDDVCDFYVPHTNDPRTMRKYVREKNRRLKEKGI